MECLLIRNHERTSCRSWNWSSNQKDFTTCHTLDFEIVQVWRKKIQLAFWKLLIEHRGIETEEKLH